MIVSVFVVGKLLLEMMEVFSKWDVKVFLGEENIIEVELIKNVMEVDVIICLFFFLILVKVLELVKNFKIVVNIGVGFDNIDVKKV